MSDPPGSLPPLKGGVLAVTALALAMGTFMQVLDTTIANVSLPTIAGNLGASTDQSTWIITSFVVANGIGVPITGWLMRETGAIGPFGGFQIMTSAEECYEAAALASAPYGEPPASMGRCVAGMYWS